MAVVLIRVSKLLGMLIKSKHNAFEILDRILHYSWTEMAD